ncbi:MAG: hypothetical protein KIS66_05745 [Fimbriimonadaceae bacterium]|nr:hypothetical protein [Fimbriimonadaceae bacterium]
MKRSLSSLANPRTLAQAGTGVVSLALAETVYKFHSFSLECLAFLATWAALFALVRRAAPARTVE